MSKATEYVLKLDALWGEGEVLAHELKKSDDSDDKEAGDALLELLSDIQTSVIQSGLMPE